MSNRAVKPARLVARCFAEREDSGQWVAVCVDFSLAAQGDTFHEVRHKLHEQISCYVQDCLFGEDQAYAPALLRRMSPWPILLRYYWLRLRHRIQRLTSSKPFALAPALHAHA